MTFQEQIKGGISTLGLPNLNRPAAYSYQTNEYIFQLLIETPSERILIEEIDQIVDNTHVPADDHYQLLVENNNLDSCESSASPSLSEWELHLIQLSEQLAHSHITLGSEEYLSMSMILVPQALASLNAYALKEVNLTWSFSIPHSFPVRRKKIVYILRKDIESLTEFNIAPLDKAKSQYIAFDSKADLAQSKCLGHPEIVSRCCDFDGYYIYTVGNIDSAMHLVDCQKIELCQAVDRTNIASGSTSAMRWTMTNSDDQEDVAFSGPRKKIWRPASKSEDYGAQWNNGTEKSLRRAKKATHGPEKSTHGAAKYGIAIAESHRGHSELQLPKEWNAFNTLFRNTQLSSIQVLCLKSREVPVGARQQQSSSNHHNQRSDLVPAPHRQMDVLRPTDRSSLRNVCSAPHMRAATHTGTDERMYQSHTRGNEASTEDIYEIRVVDLTFSAKAITQLLHASHYDEIIQQLENIPSDLPPESLIPIHFIVGVAYFKTSKYRKAREHFEVCTALAEEAHRDGDVMICNAYLGDMEYASQSYREATKFYKKAVKHYASGSVALLFKLTPPTISAIHAKLASAFRNVSMMVQAIQHYQSAISKATTDRDRLSARTSLGNLHQSMGDNSNALKEYEVCIKLAEVLSDHVSLGWAHGNIGNAYLGLNRKDEALHHLHQSLNLAVEYERTPQAIGRTYNNLGTAYQSINDLDRAEEYYEDAKNQAIYGNDRAGQARVFGNIGNVHMLRKNYERAIPHYGEVLQLSTDASTISTARHNRGCAYYDWATSLQKSHEKDGASKVKIHSPECDIDTCLRSLSSKSKELYRKGADDLEEVIKYHEERLQHIKGSASGLTLSVSLFESNSRTFHRLQDCLFNLHMFDKALVVAEQSRARTLGELLLNRNGNSSINPPLKFDQVTDIVKNLPSPLIYFSYTGARLICWLFLPNSGKPTMHTFDRPLTDNQFDGKSFDYHLRYSLTEKLVERSFEMYQQIKYDSKSSTEVQKLFNLIGEPIQSILLGYSIESSGFLQLTSVSDSYTALLPLTCLQDPKSISFFGDRYYFNSVPSLLTLGIMNQTATVTVDLKDARNDFCIVGDPNIPPFRYNDDLWYLGKLPYAKREAEWVARALRTIPVLSEHATKTAFLPRLLRAKIVHVATHGSASAGFLAFAAFAVHTNGRKDNTVDASNVLLFPEEVEKQHISSALVVLSSCDSGRGTVKADGIQGMARAFILAGAQSVLTTLWKVPDESASVFMQFFYQYLIKGVQSSLALQKAILSVRCFTKYSQYIHWSGYQLTGRDIRLLNTPEPLSVIVRDRLGKQSMFPRLLVIKKLEKLVKDPTLPTDVQVQCNAYSTIVTTLVSSHGGREVSLYTSPVPLTPWQTLQLPVIQKRRQRENRDWGGRWKDAVYFDRCPFYPKYALIIAALSDKLYNYYRF